MFRAGVEVPQSLYCEHNSRFRVLSQSIVQLLPSRSLFTFRGIVLPCSVLSGESPFLPSCVPPRRFTPSGPSILGTLPDTRNRNVVTLPFVPIGPPPLYYSEDKGFSCYSTQGLSDLSWCYLL